MKVYKNQNISSYKELEKISVFSFFMNLPNFIVCIISAVLTGTAVVFVDTVVSFGETLHLLLVSFTAHKMVHETGDKYNFGMGRLEVFASFACDLIISLGMLAVMAGAIFNLIDPEPAQSSLLGFCILKCINCTYDLIFYHKQKKIYDEHPSKLNQTEVNAYRASFFQDATVGIVAVICYVFQGYSFVLYFSPISSLILSIWILGKYILHMRDSISEITDVSIPVNEQDEIYDIVMEKREVIKKIVSVNCRTLNNKAHIEISLVLKEDTTYKEMEQVLEEMKEKIRKVVPDAEILLVLGEEE